MSALDYHQTLSMCGIVGLAHNLSCRDKPDKRNLILMRDTMLHRGPDGAGVFADNHVCLGHRRLAILDLSSAGAQPMKYKKLIIVFNGEIYNYSEIRQELTVLGHKFKTQTDTEVILHAYDQWDTKCLDKFQGMFAFAIYDTHRRHLFLARDRFGIKPLYYYHHQGRLVFASEIKAICKYSGYTPSINKPALFDFFRFTYVPGSATLFQDIFSLLPGHYLTYKLSAGSQPVITQYYDLPRRPYKDSFTQAREKIDQLLDQSVKQHLIADVPVGVQLSGGLDSSLVAHYASRHSPHIDSLSVNVQDKRYSEKKWAAYVAKKLHLRPHVLSLNSKSFFVDLDRLVYLFDEPLPHPNSIGIYLLSQFAKKTVTVLLSGEGSDELFCGYNRYYEIKIYQWINRLPFKKLRQKLGRLLMPHNHFNHLLAVSPRSTSSDFIRLVYGNTTIADVRQLLDPSIAYVPNPYQLETLKKYRHLDIVNQASAYDLKNYLVSLLQRQDRMSMAYSVENRVPFLDHRLVEYVLNLPSSYKVKGNITKNVLKALASAIFPSAFVYRPKNGFAIPIDKWLYSSRGRRLVKLLSSARFRRRGLFNQTIVDQLIADFTAHKPVNYNLIWSLITFEKWCRIYFDQPPHET